MPFRSAVALSSCSSRTRTLSIQRRAYSAQTLASDVLESVEHDAQQHKTFHVLKDGKKLPLPPLLDPVAVSECSRWRQSKEKPNVAKFTPFQKKLWENSYAHTLASPLRECRATNTLLPSTLLTSLHTHPHPETQKPWLLPVSLTTSQHHLGASYRFLSHSFMVTHISQKKVWKHNLPNRLAQKLGNGGIEATVWREDMPALLLELLRKRVAEKLAWWFGWRGRLVAVASPHSEDLDAVDHVSCVLYLGTLRTRADDIQASVATLTAEMDKWSNYFAKGFPQYVDPHHVDGATNSRSPSWYTEPVVPRLQPRLRFPRLEFKTTIWRERKVPVYGLLDMLGEEKLKGLVEGSAYEGEKCLVLKSGRQNVPVETLLMQLQMYLAEPGP